MYAIYGNIYHQYTPNVSIYTIHGSYWLIMFQCFLNDFNVNPHHEGLYSPMFGPGIDSLVPDF